ncbi:MAG: hypothetical protein ACI30W_02105 [Muribaculaceae bacterium]
MTTPTPRQQVIIKALHSLWRAWSLSLGAMALLLVLALLIPKTWLPAAAMAESFGLLMAARGRLLPRKFACSLLLLAVARIMAITSVIMAVISLLAVAQPGGIVIDITPDNREIPFISGLILFPVSALVSCAMLVRVGRNRWCGNCRRLNDFYPGDNFLATLYDREARYQLTSVAILSTALTAVLWWYYFSFYINVNLNGPDHFFFTTMPLIIYAVSLGYMLLRYYNLYAIYGTEAAAYVSRAATGSALRVLIISGDSIILEQHANGRYDTPATQPIAAEADAGEAAARSLVQRYVPQGVIKATRYLYRGNGFMPGTGYVHYAAFVDDTAAAPEGCRRVALERIMRLLRQGELSIDLMAEISRIYTITMAWKTYDKTGRRLYRIKRYVPTFHIADLKDWAVDYDDLSWYQVAANNEDCRFYRLRRLWHRLSGAPKPDNQQ